MVIPFAIMPHKDPRVRKAYAEKRYRARYDTLKREGKCIVCAVPLDGQGVRCSLCAAKFKETLSTYQKKAYAKYKATARCLKCGVERDGWQKQCTKCRAHQVATKKRDNKARYWKWKLLGLCLTCGAPRGSGIRCASCSERFKEWRRLDRAMAWDEILEHYGAICSCCGETTRAFLTIDHLNNDGAKDRRNGWAVVRARAIKEGWPSDLAIRCFNCNCGRARNGGVCPHEIERAKATG